MIGSAPLAISVPLSGTSSDEESEALPDNRVYLTKVRALKQNATKPDSSGSDSSSELAYGGGYSTYEISPFIFKT